MDSDALVNRIDLFMPARSLYGVLHHFTKNLAEALNRAGVRCRLLEAEKDNPAPFLEALMSDPPDCTLSFNGLLPDEEGRFFCDMIHIPHVCCLVDSPNHYFSLAGSSSTVIACSDLASCDFFHGLNAKHVLFMPHGVDRNLSSPLNGDRPYDVLLLSSYIDFESIRNKWHARFDKGLCRALEEAVERSFAHPEKGYVQTFVDTMDDFVKQGAVDPQDLDFVSILDDLEMVIRGKDRLALVRSIKTAQVHIYGATAEGTGSWKEALKGQPNVICHDPVPYEEAIELMKQSRIVLNSQPTVKHGAHERLFAAIACGAMALTTENDYLKESFHEDRDILFYRYNQLGKVDEQINALLQDHERTERMVELGREIVMRHHTWDHRARRLIEELGPILREL